VDGTIEEFRSAKRLAAPPLSQTAPLRTPVQFFALDKPSGIDNTCQNLGSKFSARDFQSTGSNDIQKHATLSVAKI
jgi:hypothetical protein